jgi:hypothetical protein
VVILAGALAGLAAVFLWPAGHDLERAAAVTDCALEKGPCSAALPGGGRVTLEISPRPIPLMTPVTVTARVTGSALAPQEVRVTGRNMDMGLQRVRFGATAGAEASGTLVLPVCSERRMLWEALLVLDRPGAVDPPLGVPFHFATTR